MGVNEGANRPILVSQVIHRELFLTDNIQPAPDSRTFQEVIFLKASGSLGTSRPRKFNVLTESSFQHLKNSAFDFGGIRVFEN